MLTIFFLSRICPQPGCALGKTNLKRWLGEMVRVRRWGLSIFMAGIVMITSLAFAEPIQWPSQDNSPGPGGFATIILESPRHGSRVKGPDVDIHLRSDNRRAAVRVRLDGKYVDVNGQPVISFPANPHAYPQWTLRESNSGALVVPIHGLAPGLHTLEILRGSHGTELPNTNEQKISFIVD